MSYIILGAAGQQGQAITRYLALTTKEKIQAIDIAPWNGPEYKKVQYKQGNFEELLPKIRTKKAVIISCLRPWDSLFAASKRKGNSFLDLGGDDKITEEILRMNSKKTSGTVVPDCGLAPGLPSAIAGRAVQEGKKDIRVYCGGLPDIDGSKEIPYKYALSFNSDGLIGEYLGAAKIIRGGRCIYVPTISNVESIEINSVVLEAAHTSAGLGFTPEVLESKLNRLEYKTLRYPGHWRWLKNHILWRDRSQAAKVAEKIFLRVSSEVPDLIILGSIIDGQRNWWMWQYDHENNISAMAQATGYTAGAVATMIHDGLLPERIVGMHDIDLDEIIERARLMPGQFQEI